MHDARILTPQRESLRTQKSLPADRLRLPVKKDDRGGESDKSVGRRAFPNLGKAMHASDVSESRFAVKVRT